MTEPSVGSPLSMHDPRIVGPWTIHSRLGAGGMGVVFYGTAGDRAAAVKVIRPGLLDAPATRDRFRREVSILRAVRDEHICRYLDADLENEPAWLALEYLPGPVLRDQVAANGPLPEAMWWDLVRGLSQALAVLELHRVTHRDLKPGNVILTTRGPVLIDFGIAHPEDATQLTATGLVTGSPAWLSPEQANLEPTGPATDIFTLGSLLAFAATGRPPFGEGASVAVLMSIIKREPDLAGIDPVRAGLLLRMLAKDPGQRPSAREVLDWARSVAEGADITAELAAAAPDATLLEVPPGPEPPVTGQASDGAGASSTQPDAPWWRGAPGAAAPAAGPHPVVTASPAAAVTPPAATPPVPPAPLVPPPPPRTHGPTTVGPRTAAAVERRAARRRWLIGLLAIATVLVLGWMLLGGQADSPAGSGSGSSGPASAGQAPPAPSSDQLRSGDWLLETYRFDNTGDGLVVSGTMRNRGDATASADLVVWVYAGDESLGSVSATVNDVPAGGTQIVTMTGDAIWKPGAKTVLLEATPR
jgi:tRNA A-37 threonylcarbamoyl transferase component Bud32